MTDATACYGVRVRHRDGRVQVLLSTWPGEWSVVYDGGGDVELTPAQVRAAAVDEAAVPAAVKLPSEEEWMLFDDEEVA